MVNLRANITTMISLIFLLGGLGSCASKSIWQDPGLRYEPEKFKQNLRARAPALREEQILAPFEIPRSAKRLAQHRIKTASGGQNPVDILVSILTDPKPNGLGIAYDWTVSATANRALELGRGDCVSLAMVLVGLGRSLQWPIYFAEARPENPVTHEFAELTILSSHMIVIVLTQEGPVLVDFLGLIDKADYEVHPIDDLKAYAHLLNNIAGHQLINTASGDLEAWKLARASFQLVTQIQPNLGRGWNNLGIAHTRLGDFDSARSAYSRAMELDTVFGSPSRNLTIMETRASNKPTIIKRGISH